MNYKKMRVLHILKYTLYTKAFIEFTNKYFNSQEHIFLVYGEKREDSFMVKNAENVIFVDNIHIKNPIINELIFKSEKIIIHANNIFITKLILKNPKILKKAYMIFWGFDIYTFKEENKSFKEKIWDKLAKYQISNVKGVCTLVDKDYQELQKYIPKIKGKHFKARYFISENYDYRNKLRGSNQHTESTYILLGNSASETNSHIEILEKMRIYADENIKIICPLSYGSKEYGNNIIKLGKEIFKDKFIPLTELLALEEYEKIISKCSIGIFNNNRQQGMGNISALLSYGAKVFIRSDTTMWESFVDKKYNIYDISEVGKSNWNDIKYISSEKANENYKIDKENSSNILKKDIWEKIYCD